MKIGWRGLLGFAALVIVSVISVWPGPSMETFASPGGRYRLVMRSPSLLERVIAPPGGDPAVTVLLDASSGRRLAQSGVISQRADGSIRWNVECSGTLLVGQRAYFTGLQPEHVRVPNCPVPPQRPPPPGPVRVSTGP